MSWLNINQSLSSLKGQISNFATEVLNDSSTQENEEATSGTDAAVRGLEDKCHKQELEIAALKNLTEELQSTLQSERLNRKNGVKEEQSNWYWDPAPSSKVIIDQDIETQYKRQIQSLQEELSAVRERDSVDLRTDNDEEIHRLREENKNLTCSLDDLDSQHQMAMERLLVLKKELQKNFEVLKQEHEELKSANDEYAAEIKHLLHKLGERDQEIDRIKSGQPDFDTLHHKYQNLERIHSSLRDNAEKFQEENQELHEEIFKLQEQVTKLEHDTEIAAKQSEILNMVPKDKYDELLKQLNELKIRRTSNDLSVLDEINIDDNAKGVIETLKRDISKLKHRLAQKEDESHDTTDIRTIKSDKVMLLYNRYINFDLPIDYVGEMPSANDNIVFHKLESVFKTINSFKKEIDVLHHKLSEKSLNINHLQTQIEDLTSENEYLTSDMHHIEGELEEMKKNNDFLISEIATLKNSSKLEPIIETHEDNYAKLETELDDCNKINKSFESEIKRIENELVAVKTEKNNLQESLNDMREKYTSMLDEFKVLKSETNAIHELQYSSNTTQDVKYQKTAEMVDDLKMRLINANSKNEQLAIDVHILENDKVLLTKELDDLKNALEMTSNSQKELESMKIILDHKLKDFESKLEEVFQEKNRLETENNNLKDNARSVNTSMSATAENKLNNHISEELNESLKHNAILVEKHDKVLKELSEASRLCKKLTEENDLIKTKREEDFKNITDLQRKIDELKSKSDQYDVISHEIALANKMKESAQEVNSQLEVQLTSNNEKLRTLEDEFEKLNCDYKEKNVVIDKLNHSISEYKTIILNLTNKVSDLDSTIKTKDLVINRLEKDLAEVTEAFNVTNLKFDRTREEFKKLHIEKEDIHKQIYLVHDEINAKNSEISNLTSQVQELQKFCSDYKIELESKENEIKELYQSIAELRDKIVALENGTSNDESIKLKHEKQVLEEDLQKLRNEMQLKHNELIEAVNNVHILETSCNKFKSTLELSTTEKSDLINLVNLKHNESIQYHNEIQRLNQAILEQTNEFKRIIEEKDTTGRNSTDSCPNCQSLGVSLKEKEDVIAALTQNMTDQDKLKAELVNESETIRNLTKRCEDLDKSLTVQLDVVKKLTAENSQLTEKELNSSRELERLRHHLVEMEDNYTQELMTSEQKLGECQSRLHQVEERARQTSTAYTSTSIRANQEVETLRNQIKLLEKQREEVQTRLSEADDARSRSEAALTNLQIVLEQFQLDKERDIYSATEKIRKKLEEAKYQNVGLQKEIAKLNNKLQESSAGLQAASRLGDQVETKAAQINDLKEQVRVLQASVAAAEERYHNTISNQQDKVDKNLVKNLVVNYVLTAGQNNLNKTQVLRILSTVLDFNQQECEKLGLVRPSNTSDSLAAEFVKFLQNESRPRAALPDMMGLPGNRAGSVASSRKSSTIGPHPVFEIGHRRNPSTGSNNLLFQNLDAPENTSQVSVESDTRVLPLATMETGVNQTRNNEGAILKHVLKDM